MTYTGLPIYGSRYTYQRTARITVPAYPDATPSIGRAGFHGERTRGVMSSNTGVTLHSNDSGYTPTRG